MSKSIAVAVAALAAGLFIGATQKPDRWKHKCERPFNFDDLTRMIEAREDQGWEMITVSPVVMSPPPGTTESSAYLRYVACFKRVATDE